MEVNRTTLPLRPLLIAVVATLAVPGTALGHAELVESSPESGAELDSPPAEVTITFDDELDPSSSGFVVTGSDGSEVGRGAVDLQVADRNELRGAVEIEEAGEYTVAWTAVAGDGHLEEGSFGFAYRSEDGPPSPDTALPVPAAPNELVVIGAILVLIATLWIVVRVSMHLLRRRA